ncbi:PiggyBac transposable element-derived protein 3 [Chionoecetes opilio]|uniref:PiggyBac transposable element-derived protein 3 n=1 Tax=Chionoecetes opilio TaxID=41210 RepID=A0A8J4XXK3_CHIOP|nr:PiggyBac transposable element-derived protein 3 [Chionoecetes opilio]
MKFVALLIYMGITDLPSVDDYWAMETRVPKVGNLMSSKRFRLLKRMVHFNDNSQIPGTIDRFYKIRPLFSFLNTTFRTETQTPKQSVDEVMIAYKGKRAGNLSQYIKNKPDKWGFKLFARASEDGFIHDMVLYQGKTTLEAHGVPLTPNKEAMGSTSKIVSVLASTMSCSTTTAIFADNFFTSLEIIRYLKDMHCRYTGTARDNRIGKPPVKAIKEMEKKAVPRGTCDYVTSDDGILALRWKDNRVVTLLSTDMGVDPMSSVSRYCSDTKRRRM